MQSRHCIIGLQTLYLSLQVALLKKRLSCDMLGEEAERKEIRLMVSQALELCCLQHHTYVALALLCLF